MRRPLFGFPRITGLDPAVGFRIVSRVGSVARGPNRGGGREGVGAGGVDRLDGGPDEAVRRILAVIAESRPAAVAGWPAFWARLTGLGLGETMAALETLAERSVLRLQALGEQTLYIADPPHASRHASRES